MKHLLLLLGVLLSQSIVFGQDILKTNSGETIMAKILEITPTEIKFKKHQNQTGPTYSLLKKTSI